MAFHLPVSTPPNAIVSGYANVKSKDMAVAGIGATVSSIVVLFVICQLWGPVIYPGINSFPEWAMGNGALNATALNSTISNIVNATMKVAS